MKNTKIEIRINKVKKEELKSLLTKMKLTMTEFLTNCIDDELERNKCQLQ